MTVAVPQFAAWAVNSRTRAPSSVKGKDPEYEWYPDDNRDGVVCDK